MFYNISSHLPIITHLLKFAVTTSGIKLKYQFMHHRLFITRPEFIHLATTLMLALAVMPSALASYPLVRNFERVHPGAGRQNWAIGEDALGRMYFGNSMGMLVTDSHTWQLYYLPNFSAVRSVLNAGHDRIYAGGSDEFGYFEATGTGNPVYRSLSDMLGARRPAHIGEIWAIHSVGDKVLFRGDHHIFRYDGHDIDIIPLPAKSSTTNVIGGKLYIGLEGRGLFWLNDNQLVPVEGNSLIADKRVVAALPWGDHSVMAVTAFDGIYRLDRDGLAEYPMAITPFLKENQVFSAAGNGSQYAFGTVNRGLVVHDFDTGTDSYANMATGMQNNTVLAVAFDARGNIWAGLDNGIDHILYNSPMGLFSGISTGYGAGYAASIFGSKLYLGTNQGLFTLPYPQADTPTPATPAQLLKGQVWNLKEIDGTLLVCTDAGLYQHTPAGFMHVTGVPGSWDAALLTPAAMGIEPTRDLGGRKYALVSTYDHFYLLEKQGALWHSLGPVTGYDNIGGRFAIDARGNIWIPHWIKGLYRLTFSLDRQAFVQSQFYNHTNGLPTDRNNFVSIIDGQPIISTEGGFYTYNPGTNRLAIDRPLSEIFGYPPSPRLYHPAANELIAVNLSRVKAATRDASGTYTVDSITLNPIAEKLIAGHDNFYFISPRKIIVPNQDGFFDVDLDRRAPKSPPAQTFVNRIYAAGDSTVYWANGRQSAGELSLPYSLNSLKFEFVSPEYRSADAVSYSYLLENYDSDWSPWSTANSKEYTRLYEGSYTLRVRSLNNYTRQEGEAEFHFTIRAPWYRSVPAKIVYFLILAAMLWLAFVLMRRASRRASLKIKQEKEKELAAMRRQAREETLRKDYEIAALKGQQLEHDIRHKSEELSNITMNVVRKNEILLDIAERLTKIQEHDDVKAHRTADVQKQLAKIQSVIRENIAHDDDWKDFTHNFDLAYDNFTQKLRQAHPELTESDLRICCYLRMGLSSKEIAPLLNISYRSVEMSRYRLRKKMGLTRETNLTDYLQKQ